MVDAENKGTRRRSDQEVGKKVGVQTRSGAAAKRSTTIGVHTTSAAATKRQSQRKKLEVIPTPTSSRQEPGQQSPDQPVEHGAGNEVGNNVGVYTRRRAAAKQQVKVISTAADPRQQTDQEQLDRPNQQPNVEHPYDQPNVDQHQQNNTDDGCCRVFKNKRLRDLFVETMGSNFDEAVADDGRKRYHLSKIATMHDAPHGQSDKGLDQSAQPDLQSEGQPSNSDGESSSEIAKSRISGPTRSTETSETPRLLVYTADELERLVVEALEKQEIRHRAVMDAAYQRIAERDARHAFLVKTMYDKIGVDQPEYPGISGEVQEAQGKLSNPHQ